MKLASRHEHHALAGCQNRPLMHLDTCEVHGSSLLRQMKGFVHLKSSKCWTKQNTYRMLDSGIGLCLQTAHAPPSDIVQRVHINLALCLTRWPRYRFEKESTPGTFSIHDWAVRNASTSAMLKSNSETCPEPPETTSLPAANAAAPLGQKRICLQVVLTRACHKSGCFLAVSCSTSRLGACGSCMFLQTQCT